VPLDPVARKLLDEVAASGRPNAHLLPVAEARANFESLFAGLGDVEAVAGVADHVIPVAGGAIPARSYRPAGATPGHPLPLVVYFHGGGWLLGSVDSHDGICRSLANASGAVVLNAGYRLAPEHRFPAAFDDSVRATNWVAERLADFGGTDTLVAAGDSVGGQLAASVAIARRNAGLPLSAQLLLYPVTDVAGRYNDDDINARYMSRASAYQRFGLTLDTMATFARAYVDESDATDWRVSPKRAAELHGVAPAVIHTSTLDVLRTEGNFYADALAAAGVDVIAREHPSLNHSYFGLGGVSAVADAAAAQAAEDLLDILARH
jgi:acetyl esterase